MSYVIAAPCIGDYACVEICPVGAISPGPDDERFERSAQLYIDPATCIDCAACVDLCPVKAIHEEAQLPAKWRHYAQVNRSYFQEDAR